MTSALFNQGMKRGLLVAAIFLFAGAVVNVVVAWSIVLWLPPAPYSVALPESLPVQQWPRPVPSHWPAPELEMASYEGMSPGMTETVTTAANPRLDKDLSGVAVFTECLHRLLQNRQTTEQIFALTRDPHQQRRRLADFLQHRLVGLILAH